MNAILIDFPGIPYPPRVFATPGYCDLGHEAEDLHDGLCRDHLRLVVQDAPKPRHLLWRRVQGFLCALTAMLLAGAYLTACVAIPWLILWGRLP